MRFRLSDNCNNFRVMEVYFAYNAVYRPFLSVYISIHRKKFNSYSWITSRLSWLRNDHMSSSALELNCSFNIKKIK